MVGGGVSEIQEHLSLGQRADFVLRRIMLVVPVGLELKMLPPNPTGKTEDAGK